MRLSEAIRLGSLTIENPKAGDVNACAITMAMNSIGKRIDDDFLPYVEVEKTWPWTLMLRACPWCGANIGGVYSGSSIVYHPFDRHVMNGQITIEQLADYISTIEPPEPVEKLEATLDELTSKADEVLAPYLPPDWSKEQWIQAMSVHRSEGE